MQDNCGVFGICSVQNCLMDLYYGTFYLQHRGQQYCGLSTYDGKEIKLRTHKGLMRPTFSGDLDGLEGYVGIGHVSLNVRQPIKLDSRMGEFSVCFSGNIINMDEIINEFKSKGHSFSNADEIEIMGMLIASGNDFVSGIDYIRQKVKGSYSLLVLTKDGIYATRSPMGHRPLILGRRGQTIAVASESCAFNNLGISVVRDVEPGEIVRLHGEIDLLQSEQIETLELSRARRIQYCAFEWVYFANPASVIDGQCVDMVRQRIGASLARRYPADADIVAAVPNSGIGHAIGYAQESGIPYDRVFLRYDYADRSYTQSTQQEREREAQVKLIPITEKIEGKRIVLLDDSIVRGTQMKTDMARKLKSAGAREIHVRVACPPLVAPCRYGRSTRANDELLANRMPVEKIPKYLGVNSVGYNTIKDLVKAIGHPEKDLCLSCWTGEYL
ncbi:MAG: amidophosphoribosyltransferase [Planctomycetes bacterium]|nr:amidophosphoribosyltransferase [Planctomycetota bacterium]